MRMTVVTVGTISGHGYTSIALDICSGALTGFPEWRTDNWPLTKWKLPYKFGHVWTLRLVQTWGYECTAQTFVSSDCFIA